jgi:hypothetical protein
MTVIGKVENGQIILPSSLDLPDGTSVEVKLRVLSSAEFWRGVSIDELERRQGILKPPALEDLAGD